jgi:clathrin heavy chain
MIVINKAGVLYSINVEENSLIPFINASQQIPDNKTLSFKLAQRFHLQGANEVFVQMFNQKMATGDYQGAANVAKDAPAGLLRNSETISRFKSLPQSGGPAPVLIYFNTLLQSTKLNEQETTELCMPVIQQNKIHMIEQWMKEDKLTMSDSLGDMIRGVNPQLALNIF